MKQFLGKVKFWMDKFLSIACAVLLSFMTILVLIQVFSRYVLNSPVAFTEELVRYSLIWTGFIGAAYAFSTREHMSLTLVRDKFTGKAHTALLVAIDSLILLLAEMGVMVNIGRNGERAAQQRAADHARREAERAAQEAERASRTINLEDARRARNGK